MFIFFRILHDNELTGSLISTTMGSFGSKKNKHQIDPGNEYKAPEDTVDTANNICAEDTTNISCEKESEDSKTHQNNHRAIVKSPRSPRKSKSRTTKKSRTPHQIGDMSSRRSSESYRTERASLSGVDLEDTTSYSSFSSFQSRGRLKLLFSAYQSSPACFPIVEQHPFGVHGREHSYQSPRSVVTLDRDQDSNDKYVCNKNITPGCTVSIETNKPLSPRAQLARVRYSKMLELIKRYESQREKDIRRKKARKTQYNEQKRPHTAPAQSK